MNMIKSTVIVMLALMVMGAEALKPGSKLAWDPVTTDIDGNPEVVVAAEAAAFAVGGTVPVAVESGLDPSGTGWNMDPLKAQLAEGTYEFGVRVIDDAGNISDWSNKITKRVDRTPPAAPGGCRIFR